ncbi:S-adenosyl-L-methionine-dependent methyltransferase [Phlyctochytrium arcticum]|nr:S-adenosyl-L-methionine-dependent methyltransferase [Phlyctochytrium arcticum]
MFQGPISVAQYMRSALMHPLGGYYNKGDVFGTKGDFTTSPEISQMFGELLAIWYIAQWRSLGSPENIQLLELGPGRGTLMSDMLRTFNQFDDIKKAIKSVHLLEGSIEMRKVQAATLAPSSTISDTPRHSQTEHGMDIHWQDSIETVPKGIFTMVTAHEFFDAMPVYKFELTSEGWREIQVALDKSENNPYHFCFTLSPSPTNASLTIMADPRYKDFSIGDRVEVSPDSYSIAHQIARRINSDGGSALYIDYGNSHLTGDSLRGIAHHSFTSVLSRPGDIDLSADVDFALLNSAAEGFATCHGPVTQGAFLRSMGIATRMQTLIKNADSERRKEIASAYDRLVTGENMGNVYKVMSVVPSGSPEPYPFVALKTKM